MAKLARRAKTQLGRITRDLSSRNMPHNPKRPHFVIPLRDIEERILLRLRDFTFTYPNTSEPIFSGISANVYGGERILLQGINGSGKSTLLRALIKADASNSNLWLAPGAHISWCTQNTLDIMEFDDVFAYAVSHGIQRSAADLRTIIGSALNRDVGSGKTDKLSIGERQRVALALLFAADPDIIILDEPTNHLDLITIELLEEALGEYRGSVIVATHDRRFIRNFMPDRVWRLENGTLIEGEANSN